MRYLFFLLLPVWLPAQDWPAAVHYDGRFRVAAPAPLVERVDTIAVAVGPLPYHVLYYQSPDLTADNLFYMVSYTDYPPGTAHADSTALLADFWAATVATSVESLRGELLYEAPAPFGDYPGHRWRVDYLEGQAIVKTWAFLRGNRYYALQTIALKEKSLNPSTERFFASFELLE